ncbi:MAG: hypothetical protein U0166_14680 [Acidobacteriota bacterium]
MVHSHSITLMAQRIDEGQLFPELDADRATSSLAGWISMTRVAAHPEGPAALHLVALVLDVDELPGGLG